MQALEFKFPSKADGLMIAATRWGDPSSSKAQVVIAHGMAEHMKRYARFAEALTGAGYLVYALDHRGHGQTIPAGENPGSFGEAGWAGLLDDIATLGQIAREENAALPLILFGHSMGSFAAQQLAPRVSRDIAALVLSGSAAQDQIVEAGRKRAEAGEDAAVLSREGGRTPFDWLSRDDAEVDKYAADPLCGFELAPDSLMGCMMSSASVATPESLADIRKDLPVLSIAGTEDPVNGDMAYLKVLEARWREAGIAQFDTQYYEGARHELLNETNRDEVVANVIAWLDGV